jgi:phospholipid/cholesterol/gamma-HCH transport system permease protein
VTTLNKAVSYNAQNQELICQGDWDLLHFKQIQTDLNNVSFTNIKHLILDGQAISKMDSAGAWLLYFLKNNLQKKGIAISWQKFSEQSQALLSIVEKNYLDTKQLPVEPSRSWLNRVGKNTIDQWAAFKEYLSFIGQLAMEMVFIFKNPAHFRFSAIAGIIYRTGFLALPIIALLSFMIGVVITYQMGLQLRNYGANVFIVDLLGLAVLREFSPLLTAIMIAGRTGSAYTAELGMMKLNQEIDALNTMGVTPGELLLLPRIFGLFISLPLLTVWSDIFGIFGGMVMSNNMLHITWYDFLHRFPHVIPLRALLIGLGKTPVFALIIASVGCFQGMKVKGSADSVGANTTKSVVLAIFFIIVADAIFSIIFSKLKL